MNVSMAEFAETSNKLLKLRLPFYPNYGFVYVVTCDHWILDTGKKCLKFGITSQSLLKRFQFYDVGKFGNLRLLQCYPCTNARKVEDMIKVRVQANVKKGKEWVEMEFEALKSIIESVIEPDPTLRVLMFKNIIEYHVRTIREPHDQDVDIDVQDLIVRKNNLSFLHPPPSFSFVIPAQKRKILRDKSRASKHKPTRGEKKQKNIRFDPLRKCYTTCAEYKYCREIKAFSIGAFASDEIALERAIHWQQATISEIKEKKINCKRNFDVSKELEDKVKIHKGIRLDRHRGIVMAFVQRQNVSIRKTFSYRKLGEDSALGNAIEYRKRLLEMPFASFQQLALENKRRKKKS